MTCYMVKRYVDGGRHSRRYPTVHAAIKAAGRALATDSKAVWVYDLATGKQLYHATR